MTQVPTAKPTAGPSSSPSHAPAEILTPATAGPSSSPVLATAGPTSLHPSTVQPTLGPSSSPSYSPSPKPTQAPASASPTGNPSQPPQVLSDSIERTSVSEVPRLKMSLIETQGQLSEGALTDLSVAVNSFYNVALTEHYNKDNEYFRGIDLVPVTHNSITQGEPVRNLLRQGAQRKMQQGVSGTNILYDGTIEFVGDTQPSSSEIVGVITALSREQNTDLVSSILSTGNPELSNVYMVVVEEDLFVYIPSTPGGSQEPSSSQNPSSSPSSLSESFLRNPDAIQGGTGGINSGKGGPDTATIVMIIVVVATVTMLIFAFASRSRRSDRGDQGHGARSEEIASFPVSRKNANISNDLDGDAIVSSALNEYAQGNANPEGSVPEEESKVEDMELQGYGDNRGARTAAEMNCVGTMSVDKEHGNEVIPKLWLNAMHGDNSSIISHKLPSQLRGDESYGLGLASSDDTSTENFSQSNCGGFPGYSDGAFPCNTRELASHPVRADGSHIGTVEEDDTLSASKTTAKDIVRTLSQETDDPSKASLNQFISDLVWLEERIAQENAKEEVEINLKGSQDADDYSYECDTFSPRSFSDDDSKGSTITSITNSQAAMSIVCRDVYVPPGNLAIEISSTKDGPVIKQIKDISLLGHLNVGDLILSLDDRDTRSLTAEQLATSLSSRASFKRKLTLLQFGGKR